MWVPPKGPGCTIRELRRLKLPRRTLRGSRASMEGASRASSGSTAICYARRIGYLQIALELERLSLGRLLERWRRRMGRSQA